MSDLPLRVPSSGLLHPGPSGLRGRQHLFYPHASAAHHHHSAGQPGRDGPGAGHLLRDRHRGCPLAYQWRKNGTDIPGAAAPSYTTPATSSADNNAQFTVNVSNGAGSVLSNAASLTVMVVPDFNFTVAATSIVAGANGNAAISANRTNGHTTAITFAVPTNAQGITGSGTLGVSATTGTLNLTVSGAVAAGTYALNVNATDGTLTRSASCNVTVTATPVPDFQILTSPTTVTAGTSGASAINLTRSNGHTTAITLSVPANVQGLTGTGTVAASATVGTLSLTVPALVAPGPYSLIISGTDGTLTHTTTVNLKVTATLPKIRLFTMSWGDNTLRITDDALNIGSIAAPRTISGSNTQLSTFSGGSTDTVAVDRTRKMVYVLLPDSILVWHNTDTVSGNVAPDRVITIAGANSFSGLAVDSSNDRLYLGAFLGGAKLLALANASTLNGAVVPAAQVAASVSWMGLDVVNNRIYTNSSTGPVVTVFDGATTLTNASTPSRVITFMGFDIRKMAVDAANNRLYLSSRSSSPGGFNLFSFANASTLSGTIASGDTSSAFRYTLGSAENLILDNGDRLYFWADSATDVRIFYNASALSGTVTAVPDKVVGAVVFKGYGLDYQSY